MATAIAAMAAIAAGDQFKAGYPSVQYALFSNAGSGNVNYDVVIATTYGLTYTTAPLAHAATWIWAVRAENAYGREQNIDAVAEFELNSAGADISDSPPGPTGLRACPIKAAALRVEWTAQPVAGPSAPLGYHIYLNPSPALSYALPTATVLAGTVLPGGSFSVDVPGLLNGVQYLIGVRAYNAVAEEANTNTVTATPDSEGPSQVTGLSAVATV